MDNSDVPGGLFGSTGNYRTVLGQCITHVQVIEISGPLIIMMKVVQLVTKTNSNVLELHYMYTHETVNRLHLG